jgi:hypothetical protein
MYVHVTHVSGAKMVEKKYSRISVRVPQSWKKNCHEKGISISYVCRGALFQAMNQSEKVLNSGSKFKSKQQAAMIFNSLKPLFVRTITPEIDQKLNESSFKTSVFRDIFLMRAEPEELIVLGEFLDQGEYAEEILQEVYFNDN